MPTTQQSQGRPLATRVPPVGKWHDLLRSALRQCGIGDGPDTGSSGIGFALVKQVAEAHGSISVVSPGVDVLEEGEGILIEDDVKDRVTSQNNKVG